jgi:sterol desaturase/sphingolipid hydroxylase (fatty acid hydroxylase superfamily)
MHADVETHRPVAVDGKSAVWSCALLALVALALLAWALESSILFPSQFADHYAALKTSFSDWAAATLPASLLPIVRTFAALALSPLLYLGFAAVLVAERLAPADVEQPAFGHGAIHDGVAWYLINTPLRGFVFAATLGLVYFVLDRFAPFLRVSPAVTDALPTWLLVIAALVVGDLGKWLQHYASHKVPFLWHFHSVHHSQRELNLFTQARFHAVEMITLAPILYLPLYVLNLDFELAVWILLAIEWHGRITHANLRTNFGPLRYALVTPQSHRVHHSRERQHHDRNFGTLFSIWDRLFGTQWRNDHEYPATGIDDERFPFERSAAPSNLLANYFAQLVYPFSALARSRRDPADRP